MNPKINMVYDGWPWFLIHGLKFLLRCDVGPLLTMAQPNWFTYRDNCFHKAMLYHAWFSYEENICDNDTFYHGRPLLTIIINLTINSINLINNI